MMDVLFEQKIIQNIGLGAEAIWQAVCEANEAMGRAEGVSFPLAFMVLPIVFHRRTVEALYTKTQPGAIYKALAEDREIIIGLQERMEALFERTLNALSISFSSGLLRLDRDNDLQLYPGRKTPPITHVTNDVKKILSAAKRVGQTFSELTFSQITSHLGVRF